jgi:cyclopropane-fatty-acyl-phospholipid synthase
VDVAARLLTAVKEVRGVARTIAVDGVARLSMGDVGQSLRPHYALTLAAWVRRVEDHSTGARRLVSEEVYRTWRLYMSAAHRGFERGALVLVQLLLARPAANRPAEVPLRPWW